MQFFEILTRDPAFGSAVRTHGGVKRGANGTHVQLLQLGLLAAGQKLLRSTKDMSKFPDGIFGQETFEAVCSFQRSSSLAIDGVAGPLTVKGLSAAIPGGPVPTRDRCGCTRGQVTVPALFGVDFRSTFQSRAQGLVEADGRDKPRLPTTLRPISASEINMARTVFGNSLDFSKIFATDGAGLNGQPFTVAVSSSRGGPVIINFGTLSPSRRLLIHELTHAWQSQHSQMPQSYMGNSVASLAAANAAQELLKLTFADKLFTADSYALRLGKNFDEYGAEQIAEQVENGVSDIVRHVAAAPPNTIDTLNDLGLLVPRFEYVGAKGVTKF